MLLRNAPSLTLSRYPIPIPEDVSEWHLTVVKIVLLVEILENSSAALISSDFKL